MASGRNKLKQQDNTAHLFERLKSGTLATLNAGEDVKHNEFPLVAGGNTK